MKKLYSLFAAVALAVTVNAQTTIYSESMGTGASGNPVVSAYTGWQNTTPIAYTGTADVRTSGASTGYTGATGSNCVFFAATGGRVFTISGINTSAASESNLRLSFGYASSQANRNLTVETSVDGGTTWVPLATVSNTNASWALKSVTSGIPSSSSLSLRFTGVDTSSGGLRIDDVTIVSDVTLGVSNDNATKANLVKNTIVSNTILFAAKSDVQVINANGQVVKAASVNENSSLEVSSLPAGIYIVTGNVNGKAVSQKIIKK